jgi:hypothetical protein
MTVTTLGTPGDCRSVRDRERARAGTSRGGYRTASRGDAEGRPERADLYSMRRWRPSAERRKYSAFGVPASAERPRPRSHSVAGRPALGWL